MFGLKKWMDNIVRTKKSKAKKHEHRNGIMVGSPTLIRRIEISPLQTTAVVGRAGWKTPDSPGKTEVGGGGRIEAEERFRYNYHPSHGPPPMEGKKVVIETRPQHQRSCNVSEERKHYSHSSGTSEFGSVMNYISSPESAYYTGYSTHSDDCVSPATNGTVSHPVSRGHHTPRPSLPSTPPPVLRLPPPPPIPAPTSIPSEFYYGNHSRQNSTTQPSFHTELTVPQINCPSSNVTPSYVDCVNISPAPSPRQRPRIRTNPWYKNQQPNCLVPNNCASSPSFRNSSGGSRQSSLCGSPLASRAQQFKGCDFLNGSSPNSQRKRKLIEVGGNGPTQAEHSPSIAPSVSAESLNEEDDSTLKEIMGKFDEISYTYDKETDILSDSSDHTQCQDHSDYEDTGQEADGEDDEEIDYIDTNAASITEPINKYQNSGSCEYYEDKQPQQQVKRASLKLRKRLRRKSKRSECNTPVKGIDSPQLNSRECRSVGGTPILNRRGVGVAAGNKRIQNPVALNNVDRCNSLSHLNSPQKTLLTIAESEKQLLKSDLEAFMKYRELITEAETILVSFGQGGPPPPPPQLPPRSIPGGNQPHHLPNKRVEMLRAEVATTKRSSDVLTNHHTNTPQSLIPGKTMAHHSPLPVHRKIELLKQEQYAFGPPKPPTQTSPATTAPKLNAKENYPPPYYSPKPPTRKHFAPASAVNCPKSEPMRRKVYGGAAVADQGKQEMILKTLQDLKRKLQEQKTQLYSLNEK